MRLVHFEVGFQLIQLLLLLCVDHYSAYVERSEDLHTDNLRIDVCLPARRCLISQELQGKQIKTSKEVNNLAVDSHQDRRRDSRSRVQWQGLSWCPSMSPPVDIEWRELRTIARIMQFYLFLQPNCPREKLNESRLTKKIWYTYSLRLLSRFSISLVISFMLFWYSWNSFPEKLSKEPSNVFTAVMTLAKSSDVLVASCWLLSQLYDALFHEWLPTMRGRTDLHEFLDYRNLYLNV